LNSPPFECPTSTRGPGTPGDREERVQITHPIDACMDDQPARKP